MTQLFYRIRVEDPYLEASLIKLNVPDAQIRNVMYNDNIRKIDGTIDEYVIDNKIYVAPGAKDSYIRGDQFHIQWNQNSVSGFNGFVSRGYVYAGDLDLTQDDIDMAIRKKDMYKYNL